MKRQSIIILSVIFSLLTINFDMHAGGEIIYLKAGTYQIEYPNQLINVYFTIMPSGGFESLVTGLDLSEDERHQIVIRLRNQIDKLPADFIGKFLSVDIHPLHIRSDVTFGYYYENQIVVEISKSKLNTSADGSIESNFLHEVAHRIYNRMKSREETIKLMEYLEEFQTTNPSYSSTKDLYDQGYVSRYASGRLTGTYEADEEFSELFALLVWEESRQQLFNYISTHEGSLLAQKLNKYIDYLEGIVPSLSKAYLHHQESQPVLAADNGNENESPLLHAHELKSNESYDFNITSETANEATAAPGITGNIFTETETSKSDASNTAQHDYTSEHHTSTISMGPYHNNSSEVNPPTFSVKPTSKKDKNRRKRSRRSGNSKLTKMSAKDWGIAILSVGVSIVATHYINESLQSTIAKNGWTNRVNAKP